MKYAIAAAVLALAPGAGAEEADIKTVAGALPGEAPLETQDFLAALADRDVVLLDLDMRPLAWPVVTDGEGNESTPQTCAFGMIDDVEQVQVPTGASDLAISVWLGNREDHAANGLSCEVGAMGVDDGQGEARMRLTGCYLVRSLSLPTKRALVLNPLPASACGLHG